MKMRKSIHKFLALAVAVCMLIPMLAACDNEVDAAAIMSQYRLANNSIDLSVGDVTGLTIIDEGLSDVNYTETWSSDNLSVATVSNGIVTAVDAGTATVKVTIARSDIEPFDLYCVVNVSKDVVPVNTVMLSSSELTVQVGTSNALSAVVLPTDATDKTLTWTSSDPSVATVVSGIINGVSEGTAVITATSSDGLVSASCTVTVEPLEDYLSSFSLSKSSVSLYVGNSTTLKVTYEPSDLPIAVVWTSSDSSVATVSDDGVVKAVSSGSATITASYKDTVSVWEKTCKVTVSKQSSSSDSGSQGSAPSTTTPTTVKATGVKLDKNTFYINIGEVTSWKITATVTPSNTTEKGSWSSSDPSLITIDSEGNAKVVAKSLPENTLETVTLTYKIGNVTAAAVVVLQDKVDNTGDETPGTSSGTDLVALGMSQSTVSVNVGATSSVTLVKNPVDSDESITWSSADTSIATVDSNGKITGIKAGSTVIYAKSSRTGMQAQCVVIVSAQSTNATGISLSQTNATIETGMSLALQASLVPSNATSTVSWVSSMPSVASVDQNGKVTGVAMGTAVITATTSNGLTATCVVTVAAVTVKNITVSVKLNATGDLVNGNAYTATIQFSPALSSSDISDFYYDIYSDDTSVVNTMSENLTINSNTFTVIPGEDGVANLYPYIVTSRSNYQFTYVPLSVSVNSPSSSIKTPVKSITLSVASGSQTMYPGSKLGLSVKVSPAIHDDILTWTTSDSSVATVENGIVTAVGPGVATITYKAKGNLTTNGISKSIKVTVQSTGSINESLSRIIIMQGASYKIEFDSSKGTLMSCNLSSQVAGVTLDPTTATIYVGENVAAGTTFQLVCYYVDSYNQYQMQAYNVIVQRAATSSTGDVYAKYSITVEDGVRYDWSDFGFNFTGYDLRVEDEDDCRVTASDDYIKANLVDDDKGYADIEVYDGSTKVAEITVTVVTKEFVIEMDKNDSVNVKRKLAAFLDVDSVNVLGVTIDSQYSSYISLSDDYYIKSNTKTGTAYATVYYTAGGSSGSIIITIEIG